MEPHKEIVERVFEVLNEKEITNDLAGLFGGMGESMDMLVKGKEELQEILIPFVFGGGKQSLHMAVSKGKGVEFLKAKNAEEFVEYKDQVIAKKKPGEMELHAIFDEFHGTFQGKSPAANTLQAAASVGGMPTIEFIADVARGIVAAASRSDAPKLESATVLKALKEVFPATNKMLNKALHVEESTLGLEYIETSQMGDNAIVLCLTGVINISSLRTHYASVEHLLSHLKNLNLVVHDLSKQLNELQQIDPSDTEKLSELTEKAGFFLRLELENKSRSDYTVRLVLCLKSDSEEILSMHPETELPLLSEDEKSYVPVYFDIEKGSKFLISVNPTVKVSELGCASYSAPTIFLSFDFNGRESPADDEMFTIKVLSIAAQSRVTKLLLKPFINVDLFRSLLIEQLRIDIGVAREEGSSIDSRIGQFLFKYRLSILKPRAVFMKCLTFFMKRQLSGINILDLLSDFFTALGSDFSAFAKAHNAKNSSNQESDD